MTLRSAIKQTLGYSAFFDYPLTIQELHFWLIINKPVSRSLLIQNLPKSLPQSNPPLRKKRRDITATKLKANQMAINFLRSVPTIKLIALTGSLSMDNAKPDDDLDLMLVTTNNTLWLTRLFVIPIFRFFFKVRTPLHLHYPNSVCLNLWLDESALKVPENKHNLYIAHEVLQIKPLLNRGQVYEQFIHQNSWTATHLANAYKIITSKFSPPPHKSKNYLGLILSPFNLLAFKAQYTYMKSKITREHITLHSAYFHPRDLSAKLNKAVK